MGSASVSSQDPRLVSIHNSLQIAGFCIGVLVLGTAALSKNVQRSATWFLFISLWMAWCVVYFLLVGQQLGGLPSREVCTIQGVMINAISAANCWSILALSLEVFLLLYAAFRQRRYRYMNWSRVVIFCLPILVLIFAFIEQLVIAVARPESVSRHTTGAFCVLQQKEAVQITFALILIAVGLVFFIKLASIFLLYKTWSTLRGSGVSPVSIGLVIRVLIFTALPVLVLVIMVIQMRGKNDQNLTIVVIDCLPIAAAVILGAQGDILRVWISPFRRDRSREGEVSTPVEMAEGPERVVSMA